VAERGRPRKGRPEGWGPDLVLRWLEENPRAPLGWLLDDLASEEEKLHVSALVKDVRQWRTSNEQFRHAYEELQARRRYGGRTGGPPRLARRPGMKKWQYDFAVFYQENGYSLSKACTEMNRRGKRLALSTVYELRKKDPIFRKLLEDADASKRDLVESLWWWGIEEARQQGDARTVVTGAMQYMERAYPQEFSRSQQVTVQGEVTHRHIIKQEKAMAEASEKTKALFAPVVEVIDEPKQEERELESVTDAEYLEQAG
jgi:hypothetical protein